MSLLLCWFLLSPTAPAKAAESPAAESPTVELPVVSVNRPIELAGRTVKVPRKVYLDASAIPAPAALVGRRLAVHRAGPGGSGPVGELEIVAVDGPMLVATVFHDGVTEAAKRHQMPHGPAVMVGDMARIEPTTQTATVDTKVLATLRAERDAMERALRARRPKKKPSAAKAPEPAKPLPKYQRKVMRWKL